MALAPPLQDAVSLSEASTSTSTDRPDAHTQRYDRQLRLWAKTGQQSLELSNLLIVNGGATGSSTLKNLVLPGVGRFTILDPEKVTEQDIGNNFFLEKDSIGKSRAEEVVRLVGELNPDSHGSALLFSLEEFLEKTSEKLQDYNLIITIDPSLSSLLKLSQIAWENNTSLIHVRSCGFYGSLRVQSPELTLVETHPESLIDLRIHNPFPELEEYARKFRYEEMDGEQHAHVPAVVILLKALESWRSTHEGKNPSTFAERKELTQFVLKEKRNNDEDNFDEAVALFRRAGNKPGVPREIEELFKDPRAIDITPESTNFWLLVNALQAFTIQSSSQPFLPLSGALPDMKSLTTSYVDLQSLYKSKARSDLQLFNECLKKTLEKIGRKEGEIGEEEVEAFVKHSGFLRVVRGTKIMDEYSYISSPLKGKIQGLKAEAEFSEIPSDTIEIFLSLHASLIFHSKNNRYPGTLTFAEGENEEANHDLKEMEGIVDEILGKLEGGEKWERLGMVLHEVCRAGASDLPQIAALLGGLVAQEAIKLITKQYVPLEGTCVYNGIVSGMGVVKA